MMDDEEEKKEGEGREGYVSTESKNRKSRFTGQPGGKELLTEEPTSNRQLLST